MRYEQTIEPEWVSFIGPWNPVYIITCGVVSSVPFLIGFLLGFSVASDVVFGVYIIIGGFFGDMLFTRVYGYRVSAGDRKTGGAVTIMKPSNPSIGNLP